MAIRDPGMLVKPVLLLVILSLMELLGQLVFLQEKLPLLDWNHPHWSWLALYGSVFF